MRANVEDGEGSFDIIWARNVLVCSIYDRAQYREALISSEECAPYDPCSWGTWGVCGLWNHGLLSSRAPAT